MKEINERNCGHLIGLAFGAAVLHICNPQLFTGSFVTGVVFASLSIWFSEYLNWRQEKRACQL